MTCIFCLLQFPLKAVIALQVSVWMVHWFLFFQVELKGRYFVIKLKWKIKMRYLYACISLKVASARRGFEEIVFILLESDVRFSRRKVFTLRRIVSIDSSKIHPLFAFSGLFVIII